MTDKKRNTSSALSNLWKTIDDVNATLDSISLVSGGIPTKTGVSLSIAEKKQRLECKLSGLSDGESSDEKEDSDSLTGTGEAMFNSQTGKVNSNERKDAILQAELNQLFPYNFSNETIEKNWRIDRQEIESEFDDCLEKVVDVEHKPSLQLPCLVDSIALYEENSFSDYFTSNETNIRPCSPPLSGSNDSSSQQLSSMCSSNLASSDHVSSSEQTVEECSSSLKTDVETVSESDVKRTLSGKIPSKRIQNALLNSLCKRGLKEVGNINVEKPISVETTDDLLVNLPKSNINSIGNNEPIQPHCHSISCLFRRNAQREDSLACKLPDSNSFQYRPEEFPAL